MKNILLIVANPRQKSLSFTIANRYKELSENQNNTVELLDLYRDKYQQGFFTYENTNERIQTKEMEYYQAKIAKADELVFVFPYWWGSYPAILKNFFDWNFSGGFAFDYVNSRPVGLLKGKKVKVFTTTGAPSFIYTITGANRRLKCMMKKQIIEFCGMKLDSFNIFGGVGTSGKNIEKILQRIKL